jgi:hypothetical protein
MTVREREQGSDQMATLEEIRDEQRRARQVRFIADLACTIIMQTRPSRSEAEGLVEAARRRILELFPGREETYEILYARRFRRVMDEFVPAASSSEHGRVVSFPLPTRRTR